IGRRYFYNYSQIRRFWRGLAWLLIPVAAVAVWQVLFGQYNAYALPTSSVTAEAWAAAGSGSLRNNVDGTSIAMVSSTFFGAWLAVFAAVWVPIVVALCMSEEKRSAIFRTPYLYIGLTCSIVGLFFAANRTAVAMVILAIALLLVIAPWRNSIRFLLRITGIAALVVMSAGIYRATTTTDLLADRFQAFTSFLSGLLDAPAYDVQSSRYAVVGTEVLRGVEFALAEVGPFGRGLGLLTQGTM